MIGEWDDGSAHTQNHSRVDLTVGVRGAVLLFLFLEIVGRHGQHDGLFLHGVDVLHHTTGHQILPTENSKSPSIL